MARTAAVVPKVPGAAVPGPSYRKMMSSPPDEPPPPRPCTTAYMVEPAGPVQAIEMSPLVDPDTRSTPDTSYARLAVRLTKSSSSFCSVVDEDTDSLVDLTTNLGARKVTAAVKSLMVLVCPDTVLLREDTVSLSDERELSRSPTSPCRSATSSTSPSTASRSRPSIEASTSSIRLEKDTYSGPRSVATAS